MTRCSVRVPNADASFGYDYCDKDSDLVPSLGAGIAVCDSHQGRYEIRNYRGATILEER